MPKKHQQRPAKERVGRNYPEKGTPVPAGEYKKSETYHEQAMRREDPGKQPPQANVPPSRTMHPGLTHEADSRKRTADHAPQSKGRTNEPRPREAERGSQFAHDLEVAQRPAGELGMGAATPTGAGYSALDFKELHTKLADLTDDELARVPIVPTGTRLDEGAQYIDLNHLENGAFVVSADMIAEPEHYYVAKKETDYVLWNRLNQVDTPARLDEPGPPTP